jgi:ABC-type uncharacterized transport system substrate-binding protein
MIPAMKILSRFFAAAFVSAAFAVSAQAHPHVWVTTSVQLIYAPDGSVTGVRHAWTFDDMYSAFATEGLAQKTKGVFTREELAGLAEVNVTTLKDSEFFTFGKANGKKLSFGDATDYWLDFKNEVLTLYFTLPMKAAVKAQNLELEIYDPSYFVDFAFAAKDPVTLVGAPAQCKSSVQKPQELSVAQGKKMDESFFTTGDWGAKFAKIIAVKCP